MIFHLHNTEAICDDRQRTIKKRTPADWIKYPDVQTETEYDTK